MNSYLLFKSLHLIAVISWMAGLLYLPRIFVYHVENLNDQNSSSIFKTMERKLFFYIMMPAMILSWIFGLILIFTIIFMSLIYLLIGFGINKDNAKYLLAGYNTMTPEQRQKFNIEKYLEFLNPFFKKLSLYPPLSFGLMYILFEGEQLILIWSLLQLLPFVWFTRLYLKNRHGRKIS